MHAPRTILHPTDFSECSRYAFRLACLLARKRGARLIVLHVRTPAKVFLYEGVPVVQQLDAHDAAEEAELRRLRPRQPNVRVEHRLEQGLPAEEILRVAEETGTDLIVLGTHGRTGLGRVLLGSVAEQVLRKAACPVLVGKAPPPKAATENRGSPQATRVEK